MKKSEDKFWESVLQMPLLQGHSGQDVLKMAEHVRFNFYTASDGSVLASPEAPCTGLVSILSGNVIVERSNDDKSYVLREWCHAPFVIEPRALFGLNHTYERRYIADGDVHVLAWDRATVRDVMMLYPTFRLNFLNSLCFSHSRLERGRWRGRPASLERQFISFLSQRVAHPAGHKELIVRMQPLAEEFGVSRLRLSRALHSLAAAGLLNLHRGRIVIPHFESLAGY